MLTLMFISSFSSSVITIYCLSNLSVMTIVALALLFLRLFKGLTCATAVRLLKSTVKQSTPENPTPSGDIYN